MATSKQLRKNETHFWNYFAPALQLDDVQVASSRGRILKYNKDKLQVFCLSKRRMVVSQDYFLSKVEAQNREILSADINNQYLAVSLLKNSTGERVTKFVAIANNQDLGEIRNLIVSKVISLEDLPTNPGEVRLAVITKNLDVIALVRLAQ